MYGDWRQPVSYTHLIYAYIGILGGIGVGFSAQYGWQAVFNTFGALAIATESYGLKGAVGLRVIQNVFGVVFALIFCSMFYWLMSKKGNSGNRGCKITWVRKKKG